MRVPLTANRRNHANVVVIVEGRRIAAGADKQEIKLLRIAKLDVQGTTAPQEAMAVWLREMCTQR